MPDKWDGHARRARRVDASLRGSELTFLKVEGGGNDFVLLDARRRALPDLGSAERVALMDRHRGIGGDGLLVLDVDRIGDSPVRVRFWNPDGRGAAFCGNGARCVAVLLFEEQSELREVEFIFAGQFLRARRASAGEVSVLHPDPTLLPLPPDAPPLPFAAACAWIDAGVPHWIVPVPDVHRCRPSELAPPIRSWPALGSGGTNVDFVEIGDHDARIRTWERGVEGETLSCGSGILAAGYWAGTVLGRGYPQQLFSHGGDRFRVWQDHEGEGFWVEGPARIVFAGLWTAAP